MMSKAATESEETTRRKVIPHIRVVEEQPKSCLKQRSKMLSPPELREKLDTSSTVFIPVDKISDKEKTMGFPKTKSRRLKTNQERVYMFLEHPAGWTGFIYHISV